MEREVTVLLERLGVGFEGKTILFSEDCDSVRVICDRRQEFLVRYLKGFARTVQIFTEQTRDCFRLSHCIEV